MCKGNYTISREEYKYFLEEIKNTERAFRRYLFFCYRLLAQNTIVVRITSKGNNIPWVSFIGWHFTLHLIIGRYAYRLFPIGVLMTVRRSKIFWVGEVVPRGDPSESNPFLANSLLASRIAWCLLIWVCFFYLVFDLTWYIIIIKI